MIKSSEKEIEAEIRDWAATVRHGHFASRQDFNFEVCNRLMAEGLTPTAALVLRVGSWGQTAYVAEDVAAWYTALSEQLRSRDAAIPLAARRKGNQLVEQLWELAKKEVEELTVKPLRAKLDAVLPALANLESEVKAKEADLVKTMSQKLVSEGLAADQQTLIVQLKSALDGASQQHGEALRQMSDAHIATITTLKDSHAQELAALHEKLDTQAELLRSETQRLMLQIDSARLEAAKWLEDLVAAKDVVRELTNANARQQVDAESMKDIFKRLQNDATRLQAELQAGRVKKIGRQVPGKALVKASKRSITRGRGT